MSSNNVDVAGGFRKFLFFIIICAAAGLIFKKTTQKVLDARWAYFSRSLKEKKIQSSPPQIIFSRYGLPVIGAQVDSVSFESPVKCYEAKIVAEQLFLPLKISKLLFFKLEFGTLVVEKAQVTLQEDPHCQESHPTKTQSSASVFEEISMAKDSGERHESSTALFKAFSDWFHVHYPRLEKMPIRSFHLKEVDISAESLKGKKLSGTGSLVVDLTEKLDVDVRFSPLTLGKVTRSVSTQFVAKIEADQQRIKMRADWTYYEGHLIADILYDAGKNIQVDLQSQDLPLSVLNRWFDTSWSFQYLWLNCHVHIKSEQARWNESAWQFEQCGVDGPYGSLSLKAEPTNSFQHFTNWQVEIQKLQLDQIFKGKEHLPWAGVLKDLGSLNGSLASREEKITGTWSVEHPSFIFSHKDKRKVQDLVSLSGHAQFYEGQAQVRFEKADIKNGRFTGEFVWNFDKHTLNSNLQVAIKELSFSEDIQKLMTQGTISPLRIDGEVKWDSQTQLVQGQLKALISKWEAPQLEVQNLLFLVGFSQSKRPQVAVSAEKMVIGRGDMYRWLFASLLGEGMDLQQMNLAQVYALFSWKEKNEYKISKSTALLSGVGRVTAEGDWRGDDGSGRWQWRLMRGVNFDWEWSSRGADSAWIPQTKEMRDWLLEHEDFALSHSFIR